MTIFVDGWTIIIFTALILTNETHLVYILGNQVRSRRNSGNTLKMYPKKEVKNGLRLLG